MSFGGMLTGGDDAAPSLEGQPEKVGLQLEESIETETAQAAVISE